MKLLLLLLFVAVYYGAKLMFRVKDVATAAYKAARDASDPGIPGLRESLEKTQREALRVANHVGEVVPGARKAASDFSMWSQMLMSSEMPGAVQPDELRSPTLRAIAASFLAGALGVFTEHSHLRFSNEMEYERFMRRTLTEVGLGYLTRESIEVGMQFLVGDAWDTQFGDDWAAGGTAARMELLGHQPLPFDNALRNTLRAVRSTGGGDLRDYRPFTLK